MAGKPQPKKVYVQEGSGRPSKFTPERCAAIVNAISKRVPYEFAAEGNGICESTLFEWIALGKAHRMQGITSDYSIFSESIKRAEMDRIIEHNENIASHVDKWQGDAWLLERRWYKHYGSSAPIMELNQRMSKIEQGDASNGKENEERCKENDKEI